MKKLTALLVPMLVAACSPYSFQKEVTAFTTGVTQLSDTYKTGYSNLATDQAAFLQLKLTDAHAPLAFTPSCDLLPSALPASQPPCALYAKNGPPPPPIVVDPSNADTDKYIAALQGYANALAAVTNAADRASYDAAVAQLASSVGTVASAANAVAPGAGTIAPAAVNLIGWVMGTALDNARFDALKQAINALEEPANPALPKEKTLIDVVAVGVGVGMAKVTTATLDALSNEMRQLIKPLDPDPTKDKPADDATYKSRFAQADAIRATINSLRQNDPAKAAEGLAKAHHALKDAVNDPSRNYPALVTALGDFVSKAKALETAVSPASKTKS